MRKITGPAAALGLAIILSACGGEEAKEEKGSSEKNQSGQEQLKEFEGTVEHVHGLGYTDINGVTFASHEGLKIYREGQWWESPHHKNDYMGFNAVKGGMYVSGHPGNLRTFLIPSAFKKAKLRRKSSNTWASREKVISISWESGMKPKRFIF